MLEKPVAVPVAQIAEKHKEKKVYLFFLFYSRFLADV